MTPELAVVLSLAMTSGFIVLLWYERRRGVRFARSVRIALDDLTTKSTESLFDHFPKMNKSFFRLLFHYLIHQALSAMLWCVRRAEGGLRTIARLNRRKARRDVLSQTDSHLKEIAVHKEEIALTEKEKRVRRDAALRGDSVLPRQ